MSAKYSLDTSAILGMFLRRFPPDVVPSFWSKFDAIVGAGEAVCIDEVHNELKAQADTAEKWVAARPHMVRRMTPAIFTAATTLIQKHPIVKATSTKKNHADPFVIALAQVEGLVVVSDEQSDPNSKLIKIPDLCKKLDVPHRGVFDLARDYGWKF